MVSKIYRERTKDRLINSSTYYVSTRIIRSSVLFKFEDVNGNRS